MEEAQAKTNDIRDTIKAEILVREVEGLTAGTYIIHWASVLSNHFDITGFKKVYGDLYKAFYRLPSKLFNFTPLGQFTRNYTQTVKRAADNKRRYAPGEGSIPPVLLSGVSKGVPPLAHDFACKV